METRLRSTLTQAMTSRDSVAVAAVRSALSAIANAEAIAPLEAGSKRPSSEHVAGAVAGLGAAEAARRQLSAADADAIVAAEISDRRSAADDYERMGRADQAERLRREADVLADLLAGRE
jgi:uncharacterized protein